MTLPRIGTHQQKQMRELSKPSKLPSAYSWSGEKRLEPEDAYASNGLGIPVPFRFSSDCRTLVAAIRLWRPHPLNHAENFRLAGSFPDPDL